MNIENSRDIILMLINSLNSYTLMMKNKKEEIRRQSYSPLHQKE